MGEHLHKHARKFMHAKGRADPHASLYELEAEAMKALAHPKRLLILDLLGDGKERNVGELLAETRMSQSNLSQNLAVMRTAGLLSTRRDGNLVYYRVTDPRVVRSVTLMRGVMAELVENRQFLVERATEKRAQRLKRVMTGAYFIAGVLGALALFAVLHPLLVGGSLADAGQHAQLMVASGSFSGLVETCVNVAQGDPQALAAAFMLA